MTLLRPGDLLTLYTASTGWYHVRLVSHVGVFQGREEEPLRAHMFVFNPTFGVFTSALTDRESWRRCGWTVIENDDE